MKSAFPFFMPPIILSWHLQTSQQNMRGALAKKSILNGTHMHMRLEYNKLLIRKDKNCFGWAHTLCICVSDTMGDFKVFCFRPLLTQTQRCQGCQKIQKSVRNPKYTLLDWPSSYISIIYIFLIFQWLWCFWFYSILCGCSTWKCIY